MVGIQHLNALKERELELRGELQATTFSVFPYRLLTSSRSSATICRSKPFLLHGPRLPTDRGTGLQIPLIENLASHPGTYDTLNLTDNALISLGNIPLGEPSLHRSRSSRVGLAEYLGSLYDTQLLV